MCRNEPHNQFNFALNMCSVRKATRGGAQKGGSHEGDEAELKHQTQAEMWRWWHVGWRCQEGEVSWLHFQRSRGNPTHVATMWQQTSSHYPRGSLPSICSRLENWQLDCIELFQRVARVLGRSRRMRNYSFPCLWNFESSIKVMCVKYLFPF